MVHIGCGLDSRFERVDNGRVEWYDLDLPDVIEQRRKFMGDEGKHYHLLGSRARVKQLFRGRLSFLARGRHSAPRHRDTILLQDCFCLVLMNFHNDLKPLFVVGRSSFAFDYGNGNDRRFWTPKRILLAASVAYSELMIL